jgi:hypothetical protein
MPYQNMALYMASSVEPAASNARFQPPLKAGATQEWTLEAVGCKPLCTPSMGAN